MRTGWICCGGCCRADGVVGGRGPSSGGRGRSVGGMERGGGAVGLASSGSLSGGERGSSSVSGGGSGLSSSGLVSSGSSSSGSSVGDPSSGVPAAPGDGSCSGRAFAPPPRVRVHPADEPSRRPVDGLSEGRTHPTGATRPTSGTRTGGGAPEAAADAGEAGAPRSSRFLDAAAELLCAAPERMQPLLCAWFDDARPLQRLGGEEETARLAMPCRLRSRSPPPRRPCCTPTADWRSTRSRRRWWRPPTPRATS